MRVAYSDDLSGVGAASIDRPMPTALDAGRSHSVGEHTMDRDLHFVHLAGIRRRRSRLILAVAAVGAMLAGAAGLLGPPKYTPTAQIVVEPHQAAAVGGFATPTRATRD